MTDIRYPIGRFTKPGTLSPDQRLAAIRAIADAPARLREAVTDLDDAQLDTPFRPDGWTLRQIVHHLPDSHMNLMERMTPQDWSRRLHHPESGEMSLDDLLALYAWHGQHHIAHITGLRYRKGW